jgi:hypothetical protein
MPAQEKAGTLGPASVLERLIEVFNEHWNLASADHRVAQ